MSKKLDKYLRKSSIDEVVLDYKGEKFIFKLSEELQINEKKINSEIKDQPSYYGFLKLLQSKLISEKEDNERKVDYIYARLYKLNSEKINPKTKRFFSDKAVIQLVLQNDKYNKALKKAIKSREDLNIINSCVRAFEQRAELIQTISANLRRES